MTSDGKTHAILSPNETARQIVDMVVLDAPGAKERLVRKVATAINAERAKTEAAEEALDSIFDMAASYLNICPDRHGKQKAKLEEAREILTRCGFAGRD